LGSNGFKHYVASLGFPNARDKKESEFEFNEIVDTVANTFGSSVDSVLFGAKGKQTSEARAIAITLAEQKCGMPRRELAKRVNLSERGLAVALFRNRHRLRDAEHFAEKLGWLRWLLKNAS